MSLSLHLLSFVFLFAATLTRMKGKLKLVQFPFLLCLWMLNSKNFEFQKYLLITFVSCLEIISFSYLSHFLLGYVCFCWTFKKILDINLLSDIYHLKIFLFSAGCTITQIIVSSVVLTLSSFTRYQLTFLGLVSGGTEVLSWKSLHIYIKEEVFFLS